MSPALHADKSSVILYLQFGPRLRPALLAFREPHRSHIGMPQPLLHFGHVGIVRERIGGRGSTQGMHAEAVHISVDAHYRPVVPHNPLVTNGVSFLHTR